MARLNTLPLSMWIRYYTQFAEQTMDRVQGIIDDLENDSYSVNKLMSDTAIFWSDATFGWWNAMRLSAAGPVPTVFLKMHPNSDAHSPENIYVDVTRQGVTPEMTDLVRLGPSVAARKSERPPTTANLTADFDDDRPGCLKLCLHRILPPKGVAHDPKAKPDKARLANTPAFQKGHYQTLLHLDGKLLAVVHVLISDG